MSDIDAIVHKVLEEGVDDWVSIDSLIWEAKEASGESDFRPLVKAALRSMFAEDLAEAGHIGGPDGFISDGRSNETLERVLANCESLDWQPRGGGYWLSNTPKGDRYVEGA